MTQGRFLYLADGLGSGQPMALRHIAFGLGVNLTATNAWGFFE